MHDTHIFHFTNLTHVAGFSFKLTLLEKDFSDTLCRSSLVLHILRRASLVKHLSQLYLVHFSEMFYLFPFLHLKILWEETATLIFAIIFVHVRHLVNIFE